MTRFIRRYDIEPNGRTEPFVYSFITAHPKAVVERVETCHRPNDVGVLWVRDSGDPEELKAGAGTTQKVVCVPLFLRARQAPIPDECGTFIGAFQDHDIRWFVFAFCERGKSGEPAKSPPAKDAPQADTKHQPPRPPGASASGLSGGNRTTPAAKRSP